MNLDIKILFSLSLINYILIHFYFVKNHSVTSNENPMEVSQFWRKTEYLFLLLEFISTFSLYYFTSKLINNYWLPVLLTLIFRELYSLQIDKYLTKRYTEWNYYYLFLNNTNKVETIEDFNDLDVK